LAETSVYDPLGFTRFVPWVASSPLYFVFYFGVLIAITLIMIYIWLKWVRKEIRDDGMVGT
jgi:hypothetical protein